MKNGTCKVLCKCESEQQDKMYGKNVRIANATAKQDSTFIDVRCTVCNTIHRVRPEQVR